MKKIDPFKFEELDKNAIIGRMNIFEQCLARTLRFFMSDKWARHALLVYLCVVHVFAVGYVLQILNPQIIGEFSNAVANGSVAVLNGEIGEEKSESLLG